MTEMKISNNNLKEYISLVCEMEQNKYRQERAIAHVENQIRVFSNCSVSIKPAEPKNKSKRHGRMFFTIVGGFFTYLGIMSFIQATIIGGVFVGGIGLLCLAHAIDISGSNKRIMAENAKAEDTFNRNMIAHKNSVNEQRAKQRVAEDLKIKVAGMKAKLGEMENDLDRVYSCNIVYPTYRNLIAITSFYDYLFSNRCKTLEGHEGAYNIFNTESRLDRIIVRLDDIISQLESIKYNQNMLYNSIKESNEAIDRLSGTVAQTNNELSALSNQTAISNVQLEKLAYNTELIRFNTEQERREIELRNRVDGIYPFRFVG